MGDESVGEGVDGTVRDKGKSVHGRPRARKVVLESGGLPSGNGALDPGGTSATAAEQTPHRYPTRKRDREGRPEGSKGDWIRRRVGFVCGHVWLI